MFRAFLGAPSGIAGLIVLAFILFGAFVAPLILTDRATTLDVQSANQNPTPDHWLGTDNLGRDILARVLVATRLSIGLAFAAAGLGAILGIAMGVGAAILQGAARTVLLRTIDALIAFPALLVAIFVGALAGPGLLGVVLGAGIAISAGYARVASSLSLAIAGRDYMSAARISGISAFRLMTRYALPNVADTLAITTTVAISTSIAVVSTLSFLGLGVQVPDFDWGRMLTEGTQAFYRTPAAALAPAMAIAVTALAFGFSGEAIARAMNPVLWVGRDGATSLVSPDPGQLGAVVDHDREVALPKVSDEALLIVKDLSVAFPSRLGQFPVVDGVSFWLERGDRLGIVGESGSGKTTLALAIAQLVSFPGVVTGTVVLEGRQLNAKRHDPEQDRMLGTDVAVVYQDPLSSLNPALRIGTQMTEAVQFHKAMSGRDARKLAAERLREVNVAIPEQQLERNPVELSGGMRQRVMIAMGLMTEPALLIADEPTTSLDVTIQAQIMDVIAEINRTHRTALILISHNLALVSQNTDRVLVMYAGRVVEDLTTGQLMAGGLHPYTRQLLAAIPDMSRPKEERLEYIPGQAPNPAALPSGCPYHPRCPLAFDKCRVERPALRLHEGHRRVACWAAEHNGA